MGNYIFRKDRNMRFSGRTKWLISLLLMVVMTVTPVAAYASEQSSPVLQNESNTAAANASGAAAQTDGEHNKETTGNVADSAGSTAGQAGAAAQDGSAGLDPSGTSNESGASNESGNCVALTNAKWSSNADARNCAELTIITRQGV